MNELKWDDIDFGGGNYQAQFDVTVMDSMMDSFLTISGDENPLHTNSDFAKESGYEECVVYGVLVDAFYSRLVGMYLPGKYCLLQRLDSHFHVPVFVGDTLTVSGYIKKKLEIGHTLVISAKISNQKGEVVNTAKIEVGVTR